MEDKIDFEKLLRKLGLSELANAILYYTNVNSRVTNRGLVRVTGGNPNTMKATLRKLSKWVSITVWRMTINGVRACIREIHWERKLAIVTTNSLSEPSKRIR